MDDRAWFAPKRFGIGIGMPVRWQGWALLVLFMAVAIGADRLLVPDHWRTYWAVLAVDAAIFGVVAVPRTRGGWRWRWGRGG